MVCNKFFVRGDQVTAMEQKYAWPKKLFYRGAFCLVNIPVVCI